MKKNEVFNSFKLAKGFRTSDRERREMPALASFSLNVDIDRRIGVYLNVVHEEQACLVCVRERVHLFRLWLFGVCF